MTIVIVVLLVLLFLGAIILMWSLGAANRSSEERDEQERLKDLDDE